MIKDWIQETFDKEANALNDSDIQNIVNKETHYEGQNLDFKGVFDHLGQFQSNAIKKVAIVISAFANSDGGLVIVGLEEASKQIDGRTVHYASSVTPIPLSNLTKEQLRDRVKSMISPSPLFQIVDKKFPSTGTNNSYIYLISVPKSDIRPHQLTEGYRYYGRRFDRNDPLLHWEIEGIRDREKTFFSAKIKILSITIPTVQALLLISNEGLLYSKDTRIIIERISPTTPNVNGYLDCSLDHNFRNKSFNREDLKLMSNEPFEINIRINAQDIPLKSEFVVLIQSTNSNVFKYKFVITNENAIPDKWIEGEMIS